MHLKNGNPRISDVVKVNGSVMRIMIACSADVVIHVPVHTPMMEGLFEIMICDIINSDLTPHPPFPSLRDTVAVQHSVLFFG